MFPSVKLVIPAPFFPSLKRLVLWYCLSERSLCPSANYLSYLLYVLLRPQILIQLLTRSLLNMTN